VGAFHQGHKSVGAVHGRQGTNIRFDTALTRVFLASQFDLEPRDVVYVATTGFAKYNAVISQILPTVTTVFQLSELHNLTK